MNIKPYKDKETGKEQRVGDLREVSTKRGKEIIKAGVAVAVPETSEDGGANK